MTDEELISRCYYRGQTDYVLAADAIKRLISERDKLIVDRDMAVAAERRRCAKIVSDARFGDGCTDLRSIHSMINSGLTAEQLSIRDQEGT
jgi:hypothetical protein